MPSIDDYDIGQLLGKGGFACVYRARHRISGENVALKVIAKSIAAAVGGPDANSINRVKNEILIHSQLRHSNIVRFMGCFEDDHNVYMILELCNYGNMFQFLRRNGPLSESIAVVVIQQLILALEYIHEHGVVHRDLKLSNILLARPDINISSNDCMNDKSFIKICDFGLAIKKEHPDEEHYTLCGTPNYIAPEIASQHAHGYPADLWSIGCLFYSLVVGTPPFEKEKGRDEESVHGNVKDTLQRILSGEYHEPVDKLSPTGVLFLRSLLHLNPSKRANVKQILAHPLLSPPSLPPPPSTSSSSFHLKKGGGGVGIASEGGLRSDNAPDRIAVHHNSITNALKGIDGDTTYSKRSDVMSASVRVVHAGLKDHQSTKKSATDDLYFDRNANNNSSATTALMSIAPLSSDSNVTANNTTDQGYRPIPSAEPVLHKPRAVSKHSSVSGRPMMTVTPSKDHYLKDGSRSSHHTTIISSQPDSKQDANVRSGDVPSPASSAPAASSSTHHHIAQVDARDAFKSPPYHAASDSVHYQRSHHRISCSSFNDKAVLPPITQSSSIQSDRSHSTASWYDAIVDMRSSCCSSHSVVSNSSHNVIGGHGVPSGLNNNGDSTRRYSPRSNADEGDNAWVNQYTHEKFIRDAEFMRGSSSRPSEVPIGIAAVSTGEPSHHHLQQQQMDVSQKKKNSDISPEADRAVSDYHDIVQSASALRPFVLVTKREDVLLLTLEHSVLFYTKVKIKSGSSRSRHHNGHCSRIVRLIIRPTQRYSVLFGAVVDDATSQEVRLIVRSVQSKDDHQLHTQSAERLVEATTSFTFHDEFSDQQLLVFASSPSLRCFPIGNSTSKGTAAAASDGGTERLPSVIVQLLRKIVEALRNIKCQVPRRIFYFSTPSFRVSALLHVSASTVADSTRGCDARSSSTSVRVQGGLVVDCKCMLMSNDPLPDFYIQWVDGVKLRYVLQTGRVRIDGTSHSQLYWEGFLHLNSIDAPTRPGHQVEVTVVPPTIAPQFIPYLQVAQSAFRRCLSEQDRDCTALRPVSSSSSSSSSSSQTATRPKILVL